MRCCIEAVAAAQCCQQGVCLLIRPVALGERVKHSAKANAEQPCCFKAALVTQQMQFNQQFVGQSSIQRRDDMGKCLMKGPFAVRDGLTFGQRAVLRISAGTLAPKAPPLGLIDTQKLR